MQQSAGHRQGAKNSLSQIPPFELLQEDGTPRGNADPAKLASAKLPGGAIERTHMNRHAFVLALLVSSLGFTRSAEAQTTTAPSPATNLAIAFARYPTSVLTAAKLAHVSLCRKIHTEHTHGSRPEPAGLASFDEARLMISVDAGYRGEFSIEQVIAHFTPSLTAAASEYAGNLPVETGARNSGTLSKTNALPKTTSLPGANK